MLPQFQTPEEGVLRQASIQEVGPLIKGNVVHSLQV